MQGFSTPFGRTPGQARRLAAGLLPTGRRQVALGALLLLIGSTVTVWATANTLPLFTSATLSPSSVVNEGQTVTVSGTFTDPDTADFHSIRIHWDSSATPAEQIQLPPGQFSFQVSHTYTDDLAPTLVTLTLYDRQTPPGSDPNDNTDNFVKDERKFPIQVRNVAPRFMDNSVVGTASASGVVVEGDFTDPGTRDGHQVTGAIGNPIYPPNQIPMACTLEKGERHFRCEYTQQPNAGARTYNVNLTLRDDDGGQDTHSMTVRFPGIFRP